jgi:hypothetical protein
VLTSADKEREGEREKLRRMHMSRCQEGQVAAVLRESLVPDTTLVVTQALLGPLQYLVLDKALDLITAFTAHSVTVTLY